MEPSNLKRWKVQAAPDHEIISTPAPGPGDLRVRLYRCRILWS